MPAPNAADAPRSVPTKPPLWKSRSLLFMIAITLVGVGMWFYAQATKPPAPAPRSAAPEGMVSGFAAGDPTAGHVAPAPEKRFIDNASPAVARFGGCFVAAFCVGYAFKKFIKVAAILTGVLLIAIFFMKKSGIIDLDWAAIQPSIDSSVAWLKGEAGAMKDFITGYLPSTGSAAAGLFVGFRKG